MKYYSLDDGSEDDKIECGTTQNQNSEEHPNSTITTTADANIDYSYIWPENLSNQITFSPIFMNQAQDFGVLHMTWDHSSDILTPLYEDFDQDYEDQRNLIHSIVESVLSDELEDDVFEDAEDHILYTDVDGNPKNLFNLELEGENVDMGRVYRLENELPIPLDLHMRNNEVHTGKVYKLKQPKRLRKVPA